ncbi:hypothetical protein N9P74_00555 [bacterium]|jgi:hypothetical protein|nr:hypothetical protein [bacterium]MDB0072773.1 hypothetical protein [bacterium]MDB4277907.1 hypothetical protein [Gammaproteobacteria bacterium]|tara:strand:+ start:2726 stop:3277 length:552 start_codon:yes stop_codon:yes gene_type:complete
MRRDILTTKTSTNYYGDLETVKMIKGEFFKDTNEMVRSTCTIAENETNDCVVRAFMVAFDIPYKTSHSWVKSKFKRNNGKGTFTKKYLNGVMGSVKNGKRTSLMGFSPRYKTSYNKGKTLVNPKYKKPTGYTVKSFMEQYPDGRYVIIVKGHALALVDGVLYGNGSEQYEGFRRPIHYVIKIK